MGASGDQASAVKRPKIGCIGPSGLTPFVSFGSWRNIGIPPTILQIAMAMDPDGLPYHGNLPPATRFSLPE